MEINYTINGHPYNLDSSAVADRREAQAASEASQVQWASLDKDIREKYIHVARNSMGFLHHTVSDWLPFCIVEGANGTKVSFQIDVIFTNIEMQVVKKDIYTDLEVEDMRAILQKKLKNEELDDKDFITSVKLLLEGGSQPSNHEVARLIEIIESQG